MRKATVWKVFNEKAFKQPEKLKIRTKFDTYACSIQQNLEQMLWLCCRQTSEDFRENSK